ncbi:MAG TPA: F0F1 ATP synthase subunit gamma [Candidatus Saccharimonadales bacterium]|nr:F0F1 ATP synthase subunit gamma [Candidatus Saccharimonadales bacterium]
MRRSVELFEEHESMTTLVELTSAFEGIASMRIAQIRDQVLVSQQFFGDLWRIYRQLRVDELFHFGRIQTNAQPINKELMILITSEGSFSGDIDQRLVSAAIKEYNPDKNAIIVIGHHGAVLLGQRSISYVRSFKTPDKDMNINTAPLINEVKKYRSTVVYYAQYQSLMSQDIKKIRLSAAVIERGSQVADDSKEIINEATYIFEPNAYAVVDHLESSMMQIMLSEVILESKLAQYASRFKAMSVARSRAQDYFSEVTALYNRARRQEKDERLKEIINGLRKVQI